MDVALAQNEPHAEPDVPANLDMDGSTVVGCLLDTHDKVLSLIARDAELAECLKVIAVALSSLYGGTACLIVALDPDDGGIWSGASTSPSLGLVLQELLESSAAGEPKAISACLEQTQLNLGGQHRVHNHAGEPLGDLIVVESSPGVLPMVDP
ncbi:MAG: hypothetical protein AAGA73_20405, partial [Pseudomonadota bacterium]